MDEQPSLQRRLAAILAADIAGYSRLMHADEAATVRDLKAHQSAILPLIGRHGGRIIDTAGDGIMAEFPSVIGATECAVEIQTVMAERNAEVPESRRMQLRIGINLGDVIHDETRIYGDGINIAARLEALADPGGVLVSSTVYDQVRGKLPVAFEDVGERQVKNIEQPVRMYRLLAPGTSPSELATPVRRPAVARRRIVCGVWQRSWSSLEWQEPGGSPRASLAVSQGTARRRRVS
jgi:adenylate cyclase